MTQPEKLYPACSAVNIQARGHTLAHEMDGQENTSHRPRHTPEKRKRDKAHTKKRHKLPKAYTRTHELVEGAQGTEAATTEWSHGLFTLHTHPYAACIPNRAKRHGFVPHVWHVHVIYHGYMSEMAPDSCHICILCAYIIGATYTMCATCANVCVCVCVCVCI
jgi:hypothetical protein